MEASCILSKVPILGTDQSRQHTGPSARPAPTEQERHIPAQDRAGDGLGKRHEDQVRQQDHAHDPPEHFHRGIALQAGDQHDRQVAVQDTHKASITAKASQVWPIQARLAGIPLSEEQEHAYQENFQHSLFQFGQRPA